MSAQAMGEFLGAADQNAELAAAFTKTVVETDAADVPQAIASLAQSNGFDVTAADVAAARDRIAAAQEAQGELTDDQLEDVAGGAIITATVVAAGLTAAGAIGAATIGATGGIAAAVIKNGITNTAKDIGNFFKKW